MPQATTLLKSLSLSTLLAFCLVPSAHAIESYTIESSHTFPSFAVSHLGFSTQRGRFNKTTGKITLDRAAKSGSLDITIDAASIDTGFEKLEKHLRSADFFDVEKYPTIVYKSEKIVFKDDVPVQAEGQITLHGETKPLTLNISNFKCAEHPMLKKQACGAEVAGQLNRSDFGMKYLIPFVGDEVRLSIQVEAIQEDAPKAEGNTEEKSSK